MRRITILSAGLLVAGFSLPTAFARPPLPADSPHTPLHNPAPLSAPAETTWFGGTHWDAGDQRWEANVGGLWTFDSGIGSSLGPAPALGKPAGYHTRMEGWEGRNLFTNADLRGLVRFQRRQRSEFSGGPATCVGSDASPLGGNWSLWAGLTQAEAAPLCWPGGQGYGNYWDVGQARSFAFTGSTVHLDFNYVTDSEPGFDYATVQVSWAANPNPAPVWSQAGATAGHASITLHPGVELPTTATTVTITFRFTSDGAYSDQDGDFDSTCGAFAVDDIALTGGITHATGFESGTDGWNLVSFTPTVNDFSDIRAVADLPVAPGCALGDSVLTFAKLPPGNFPFPYHPCPQDNIALSPWIDLDQAGISGVLGVVLESGGYFDTPISNLVGFRYGAQYYPDTCAISGSILDSEFRRGNVMRVFSPAVCSNVPGLLRQDLGAFVPASARRLRVGLGVYNFAEGFFCDAGLTNNSTPWFDNVRVGIVHAAVSGVGPGPTGPNPAGITAVVPNPWSGAAPLRVEYRGVPGQAGPIAIDILDVAGRFIRRLEAPLDNAAAASLAWDGRDTTGRRVREGIYFLRTEGAGHISTRKFVVVR